MTNSSYYSIDKHSYMRYRNDRFAGFVFSLIRSPLFDDYTVAVEFGAGMGRFSRPVVDNFQDVFLVEPAPSYAGYLKSEFSDGHVRVVQETSRQFIESGAMEEKAVVFCFHLMHHITVEDRAHIYDFVHKNESLGVIVEPNPFNPLILLQILLSKDMSFKEEKQYLSLHYRRYKYEIEARGLKILQYKFFCFFPPVLGNMAIQKFSGDFLGKFEFFSRLLPFLASYQLIVYGKTG